MQEWLDIVDSNDRVIGRDTRKNIHEMSLRHRASHIVVRNTQKQVFVQKRSDLKDEAPGLWDTSCAGHVDSGETYLDCAVRELREELGLSVSAEQLHRITQQSPSRHNGHEFTTVFTICTDESVVLNSEEVADGRWLSPDELDQWIEEQPRVFTEGFKQIWSIVRAHPFPAST